MDHSNNINIITAKQQYHQYHHYPSRLRKRPLSRNPFLDANNGQVVNVQHSIEEENEEIFSRRLRQDDPGEKRQYRGGYAYFQTISSSTTSGKFADTISMTATTTTKVMIGNFTIMEVETTTGPNGSIQVSHNCLLIPVAIAIWWYWFKRAARRVAKGLILGPAAAARGCSGRCNDDDNVDEENATNSNHDNVMEIEKEERPAVAASATNFDHFHDWNDVMNHNAQDPSVHFVKWFQDSSSKPLKKQKSRHSSSPSLAMRRRLKGIAKRTMVFRQRPLAETSTAATATNSLSSSLSRQTPFISRQEKNAAPPQEPQPPTIRHSSFVSNFTSTTSASFDDALSTATSTFAWECIEDTTIGVEILVTLQEGNSISSNPSSSSYDASSINPSIEAKMTDNGDDDSDNDDDNSSIHMNPLV